MNELTTAEVADPVSPGARAKPFWSRHRGYLLAGAVAVVVAIAVVTDLPTAASHGDRVGAIRSIVRQVATDVKPCKFALGEAQTLYAQAQSHELSAKDATKVPGLLNDDALACSYTAPVGLVDFADVQVPGTPAGRVLARVRDSTESWAFPDAYRVVEDLIALDTRSPDAARLARLSRDEAVAERARAGVAIQLQALSHLLSTPMPPLELTKAG